MAKTAKPTPSEARLIKDRLRKKYPQMFKDGMLKPEYAGKKFKTARTQAVETRLKNAGLSDDAIARLRGRK
jgi:hypothetical protein